MLNENTQRSQVLLLMQAVFETGSIRNNKNVKTRIESVQRKRKI